MLIVLSSFGLETTVASTIPKLASMQSEALIAGSMRRAVVLRICAILSAIAILVLVRERFADVLGASGVVMTYLGILLLYFSFRNLTSLFVSYHIARFQSSTFAGIILAARILELTGVGVILINQGKLNDVLLWVTCTSGLQLVGLAYSARTIFRRGAASSAHGLVALGAKFWLNDMMEFIIGRQADILLLGYFLVAGSLIGQYDAALSLAQGINFGLTTGLLGVAIASFSSLEGKGIGAVARYWEILSGVVVLVVLPVFVFTIAFAGEVIGFLYSDRYSSSVPLFQIVGLFLVSTRLLGGGIGANYLSSAGKTGMLLIASAASGALNLLLAIILIPIYGVFGAVVATGAGSIAIAGIHAYFVRRLLSVTLPWKVGLVVIVTSALSAAGAGAILAAAGTTTLLWAVLAFVLIFLFLSYVIKPIPARDALVLGEIHPLVARVLGPFIRQDAGSAVKGGSPLAVRDRQKWALAWMPHSHVVVDVGSSGGPLASLATRKADLVIVIDPDEVALRTIATNDHAPCPLVSMAEDLPLKSDTADTVLLLDVLEHTKDELHVVRELRRILRPGGTLIISVPNNGLFQWLDPQNAKALVTGERGWRTIHRHYSMVELRELLGAGFRIEDLHYGGSFVYPLTFWLSHIVQKRLGLSWTKWLGFLGDLDNDVSWGRLSYNLIVRARKVAPE